MQDKAGSKMTCLGNTNQAYHTVSEYHCRQFLREEPGVTAEHCQVWPKNQNIKFEIHLGSEGNLSKRLSEITVLTIK